MIDENSSVSPAPDHVACDLMGETVLLQTTSGMYYGLDGVGTSVWSLISKNLRVRDILESLLAEYDVDRQTCTRDLLELLEKMAAKSVIEVNAAPPAQTF